MSPNDLTTLARVKAWGGPQNTQDKSDALLAGMITRVSGVILAFLARSSLVSRSITEIYDGTGTGSMMLREYPVTGVSLVSVAGLTCPAYAYPTPTTYSPNVSYGSTFGVGYQFEGWDGFPPGRNQALNLVGARFPRLPQSVTVTYTAGYLEANEAWTVPADPFQVTPLSPYGLMVKDAGVTYASTGVALTAVAASPTIGQYIAPQPLLNAAQSSPTDYYQFAAGDLGAAVLLNYSYIPSAVEGACAELVSERFSYRDRIGQRAKTLASQETISFELTDMSKYIRQSLNPFRRVALIR